MRSRSLAHLSSVETAGTLSHNKLDALGSADDVRLTCFGRKSYSISANGSPGISVIASSNRPCGERPG